MSRKPKYVKKDPINHILDRPDMYVGSTRSRNVEEFVVVDDAFHIQKRSILISPAISRIFIEPISNIVDNVSRSRLGKNKVSRISITIDSDKGEISLWNDGEVVPVEEHEEEGCYNHTLIFGQLLTGSNYDDTEDREDISGRNGLGIKAVNVFSKEFSVEGADNVNKKLFKQTWKNNMREVGEPKITATKSKGYTKVTFKPDFKQFGIKGFTDDILSLYKRIVVDMAMITKVPVFLNDEEIPVKSLVEYSKLYSTEEVECINLKSADCEVVLTTAGEYEAISFANGIWTPLGGTHVDAWAEAIFRPILTKLNKPKKPQLNISDVKRFFRLFVVASVKKPEFDSQSKTKLEAPAVEAVVKKTQMNNIFKWSVMERIEDIIRSKEMVVLKKTEGKKRGYEKVEGLERANNEGTAKSTECILILVEGLSAKTYATRGLEKGVFGKTGRDFIGILPLRGKILNCRNAKPVTVAKNSIVADIIRAIGLRYGTDYRQDENYKKLRYGKVLIVTDADVDGIHINGLVQNLFHSLFPTLLERDPPFLTCMQTPIVRVYENKKDLIFYDENEYRKFVQKSNVKKIDKKYYKGLGSSNKSDVRETFGQKVVQFRTDEKTFDTMNKAFSNKYADMRKDWLEGYDPTKTVLKWKGDTQEIKDISYSDYIETELIKFSIDDCKRSIPNLIDGLKEGHRKVLYVTFLRKLKYSGKTMKVAQLAGSVAEKSAYHHGEQNLNTTITNMANAYVGSNNIPLLFRDGGFGSRISGGKDAANGRYIFTKLDALTRLIFREEDDILLEHMEDDGDKVEPKFYVPIVPMILINGVIAGIGTGWSCSIPCYNPLDIVASIKVWLENDGKVFVENDDGTTFSKLPEIMPWYREHTGEMTKEDETKYVSWGRLYEDAKGNAVVTELPVGYWTGDFTEYLETLREEKQIGTFKNYSSEEKIHYIIKPSPSGVTCDLDGLKLYKYIRTSNMVLFGANGTLKKYNSTDEIIDTFCSIRYGYYIKRKARFLADLENKIKYLGNKKRFLEEVRDGIIKLFEEIKGKRQSRKTGDIITELEERGYDKETEETDEENNDNEENSETKGNGYNYLLRLQISSITVEKIDKLKKDIASTIKERDELASISEKDIWLRELDEFEKAYNKWKPETDNKDTKKNKILLKTK
jgi:DNA topoisomerase-2